MKRAAVLVLALLLTGCSASKSEVERGMELRTKLLAAESCSFSAEITADYGDKVYVFDMDCTADKAGRLQFTVTAPETISGITGEIADGTGKLTFDEAALAFPLMADDQLTPVSAPWIFLNTLRGGYLTSAGQEGENLRLRIDDSYRENALHLDIWLDSTDTPIRADILYGGRRILSVDVANFAME